MKPVDRKMGLPSVPLNEPDLGPYRNPHRYRDCSKDLRKGENLDLGEMIRSPLERDFYQDHTYHDMWEQRELEEENKRTLIKNYGYFKKGFQYSPWIWYPGDVVEVIQGPQSGQRGSIIAVVPYKNQIIVQNINVKDVRIPATTTRPEQTVQREHPIDAKKVKHVDPLTGTLCDLRIIHVRRKSTGSAEKKEGDASGEIDSALAAVTTPAQTEEMRISLASGSLLPIPPRNAREEGGSGDPLKDTSFADAIESSYIPEELDLLVERKLRAMEEGFVERLKASYQYHHKLQEENTQQMRVFQKDAQTFAVDRLVSELNMEADKLPDWWFAELVPHMKSAAKHLSEDEENIDNETSAEQV